MYIKQIEPKVPWVSSWPPPLWEQPPMCGQITEFHLSEKHKIFHFLEPKKVVFAVLGTFLPFWFYGFIVLGGSCFLHFFIWEKFCSTFCKKMSLNQSSDPELQEVLPPQNHKFNAQKRFESPKNFWGPQKTTENDFFCSKKWIIWCF